MVFNPRAQYCGCGYCFVPSIYQKIIMLIRGEYVKHCPRCQSKMTLKCVHHVVCVKRESINKEIWKNG